MVRTIEEGLMPIREISEGGKKLYFDERTKKRLSPKDVEILQMPSIILQLGDNYVPHAGFSNLGEIPDGVRGILLGDSFRYNGVEVISGNYCFVNTKE